MKPPFFWNAGLDPSSREAAPVLRMLMTPLAAIYGAAVRGKLNAATPQRAGAVIICVGNLTVGGSGKTPVVEALRARLAARGLRAASLSRGYGGREEGPLRVRPDRHTAADAGDEPLMMAAGGESWIGRDRLGAARAMAADGVEVIILDDGHQNPALVKDLSLVVIDAAAPFGNGYLLPKGPLRETVKDGLARADAVLLAGEGGVPEAVTASGKPVLRFALAPVGAVPEGPLVAFAGIGRPLKFFDALKAAGADLKEAIGYGDHHAYTLHDIKFLDELAEQHAARLITTPKDHVRLSESLRARVLTYPVAAQFENEAALDRLLAMLSIEARA
jgi:tetraacyldisaccharide 4'-kinase